MEEQKELPSSPIIQLAPSPVETVPKKESSRLVIWIIGGICLLLAGWFGYQYYFANRATHIPSQQELASLHTYFAYTPEELQGVQNLQVPTVETTTADLQTWEEKAYIIVSKNKTIDPSKTYTYLVVARRDFLLLTRSITGSFHGDTAVISQKILCEFYPSDCGSIVVPTKDAFSEKLAGIVLQKVKQRMQEDAAGTKDYTLKSDPKYWHGDPSPIGIAMGSSKPWLIDQSDQFRVPQNPEFAVQNFTNQLSQVKTALANITSDQRKAVVFWAGGPGTKTPPGIWLDIVGKYMLEKNTVLDKYLDTQALLAMAMTDSLIGCFDSKYTYQVKRPFMVDLSIITVMPTPNHPSYPAGHACVSNAAATVLYNMLPENKNEWQRMATEASNSRVWGGIHYPVDNIQGTNLGKQVGSYAVSRFSKL